MLGECGTNHLCHIIKDSVGSSLIPQTVDSCPTITRTFLGLVSPGF